jgi:hypothetical protein
MVTSRQLAACLMETRLLLYHFSEEDFSHHLMRAVTGRIVRTQAFQVWEEAVGA